MNDTKIIDAFAKISGLTQEEAVSLIPLAHLANCKITRILKPSYDGTQDELLTMTAAALMNLWYSESYASSGPTGTFSGNGYTISGNSEAQIVSAEKLYESFRKEAADLLEDDGEFYFSYAKGLKDEE